MNDKQITTFFEVAECLSFSRAAQNLFLTQPTVTHQIISLESELGFALFIRGYRSISLTPAGRHFYESMKAIRGQIESAVQECRSLTRYHSNFLTISHYSPEGDNLFYQAMQAFNREYADTSTDIRLPASGTLSEHLLQRKLDAAILPREALPRTEELTCEPLFSGPEYCIVSRSHPLASLPSITLDQLGDTPCMLHACAPGEVLPWHERALLGAREDGLLHGGHTMREMITNLRSQPCAMFSLYPLLFISDDLVRIPFSDGPQVETVLAWRGDNDKPALSALTQFLVAFYRENHRSPQSSEP